MMSATSKAVAGTRTELLPLTAFQEYLVPELADPKCSNGFKFAWTITEGLRLSPGVNPRRLERAFKHLVRRHDSLRLAFARKDAVWSAHLLDGADIELLVEDYGEMSDDDMRKVCNDLACEVIEITSRRLCDFRLLRFGSQGDVVFLKMHHAIVDGYGMTVLVEDLIKFYLGMPVTGKGYQHAQYLENVDSVLPEHAGAIDDYWRNLLFPVPDPVKIGRSKNGLSHLIPHNQIGDVFKVSVELSVDVVNNVREHAGEKGATMFTVLSACFGDTIRDIHGVDDIIGQTILGRSNAALSSYTGIDLRFPFFRTKISDGSGLIARAAVLSDQLKRSNQFLSRELARPASQLAAELREANMTGSQFLLHVPAADGRARASLFGDLFRAQRGRKIKLGSIEIERIAFLRDPTLPLASDLTIFFVPSTSGLALDVRAERSVFATHELTTIAETMKAKFESLQRT